MTKYKVTGTLFRGQRFKAIHTDDARYALGINLYRGNVWEHDGAKWTRIKSVWN